MKVIRWLIGIVSVLLIGLGWATWKFDFMLPWGAFQDFLLAGTVGLVALFAGRLIGVVGMCASALPVVYLVLQLIFNKKASWQSLDGADLMLASGFILATGCLFYVLGTRAGASFIMRVFETCSSSSSTGGSDASSSAGTATPTASGTASNTSNHSPRTFPGRNPITFNYNAREVTIRDAANGGYMCRLSPNNGSTIKQVYISGDEAHLLCENGQTQIFDVYTAGYKKTV